MQHTVYETNHGIDPFYLYLQMKELAGENQAFLLEAGRDDDSSAYQMSIIGVCPVVEVQVKDGYVTVYAQDELAQVLAELPDRLLETNETALAGVWPSAVSQHPLLFQPADPMAFLETVRILLRDLCASSMTGPFSAGFLGYVGYDAVHYLERLPKTTVDDRNVPDVRLQWHAGVIQLLGGRMTLHRQDDASFWQGKSRSMTDKLNHMAIFLQEVAEKGLSEPTALRQRKETPRGQAQVQYDVSEETYCSQVERAKQYIRQGDIFQVVLSTRMQIDNALHPYAAYDALRRLNPSPYMFMSEYGDMRLYGASPEVQFRSIAGQAEMKPIAGTSRGRGQSREEDEALVAALRTDAKETAEHVMLVDLCRNDLGRVAESGSVHVPDLMVVERYSHLYHLVSRVEATLRPEVSVFHALLSTFPNGTLSGAPKIRAMEIIDELETLRRGTYGGFIGMVDANANANTAIVIRSVLEVRGQQYVQVGAGIVLDSVAEREWQECHHKAGAILDVLTGAR